MKRTVPVAGSLAGLSVVCAIACGEGQQANSGVTEPIHVAGAQFISGSMPGTPPSGTFTSPEGGAPAHGGPLTVEEVDFMNSHAVPGAAGKSFSGIVSADTVAIGVRLGDMGSGYWVVPVAGRDVQVANSSDFSFSAGFDIDDPPGMHPLRVVAIDGNGGAGQQVDTELCLESRIPDNLHACNPSNAVPAVVFSLQWDANFDVDLHVVTPDGRDINPKTDPIGVSVDAGAPPASASRIDRDSLEGCNPDGWRQEDLIFPGYPATGPYDIYADPFAACGQPAVRFKLTIYEAGSDGDLHATYTQGGELLANSVTGGASSGLFITEKQFN